MQAYENVARRLPILIQKVVGKNLVGITGIAHNDPDLLITYKATGGTLQTLTLTAGTWEPGHLGAYEADFPADAFVLGETLYWATYAGAEDYHGAIDVIDGQFIRDAMKKSPSSGDPEAGSIDAHLDAIVEEVVGADGVTLYDIRYRVTELDDVTPVPGVTVTMSRNATGYGSIGREVSDVDGYTSWPRIEGGDWYVRLRKPDRTFDNPKKIRIPEDGS